jgi:hypothetical protein
MKHLARSPRSLVALALFGAAFTVACAPADFDPASKLESVRILASRADFDETYPKPGDHVVLETLAVDARPEKPAPMTLYWIPFGCENPADDLYTACFTPGQADAGIIPPAEDGGASAASGDGGAPDDAGVDASLPTTTAQAASSPFGAIFQPGTDLTPYLPTGPRFAIDEPDDIITRLPVVAGVPYPYGLIIVFNIACAGHVEVTPANPTSGPQQVPLGCFDDDGNQLSADDYVIGFTRLYVHADLPNANPSIDGIIFNGAETATTADPTRPPGDAHDVPAPVNLTLPACSGGCGQIPLDIDVPSSSWEVDPSDKDANGNPRHESLWVDYFTQTGSFDTDTRLLYDAVSGKVSGTPINYTPPASGDDILYAVVHDNRDGITWVQINVHQP